jgi:hypothetical protein
MKSNAPDFSLPDWDVPTMPPPCISYAAWLQWLEENRREIIRRGLLEKLRDDPNRCPVDVPFVLH